MSHFTLQTDMTPFEVASAQELEHLKAKHGKLLEVCLSFFLLSLYLVFLASLHFLVCVDQVHTEGERTMARLKKGAVIFVPKNVPFDRDVAGMRLFGVCLCSITVLLHAVVLQTETLLFSCST